MDKHLNLIPKMFLMVFLFVQCNEKKMDQASTESLVKSESPSFGEFESQIKLGEHLVLVGGCNDCHTPKKLTPKGPVLDTALWLSGHPSQMPKIDVDRNFMETKGFVVTWDLTEWVGPWGVSYAANLTPHETGIGAWNEEQLFKVFREGKYKGLDDSRNILPPMPWEMYQYYTDNEIRAIFAYLKSIKPVDNIVPSPLPPSNAVQQINQPVSE